MKSIKPGLHYPIQLDELPNSWAVGYVGDFASSIQPGFASGKHNQEGAGIPHLRPMNIDRLGNVDFDVLKYVAPDSDEKRLQVNDVLFNNTNSPVLIGKTAVISKPGDWGFSNHMTRIVFNETVLSKYAAYQLHFLWMTGYYLHKCVKHVNQASISSKELSSTVPFVVAPLNEQTRIVAEIEKQFSRLDEAVANLKRVKANLKRYKAAVLKAAVEGKLTEEWRMQHPDVEPADKLLERILAERRKAAGKGKYKEPVAPDMIVLPELPTGWVWASVDQISIVVRGGSPRPAGDPRYFGGGDVPWITVGPITAGSDPYLREVPESLTIEGKERSRFIEAHTLLLTNSGATLGVPKISLIGGCINDGVAALLGVEYPTKLYLLYLLRTLTEWLRGINQGAAQPNLNTTIIKEISVPLPPLNEQDRIVAEIEQCLSIVAGVEAQVDANLRRADRLRQSILKQAFSGQLVPQDPNDEPASALLERIRTNASVGADRVHPERVTRKAGASVAPLRKPRPQTEQAPAVSDNFACLDDVTAAILAHMQPGREYARAELADPLGLSAGRWNAAIQDLKRVGKVRQTGEKRGARYVLNGKVLS